MSQVQRQRPASTSTTSERTCPECGGDVRAGDQETVCDDCGLVVDEDRVDRGPDWGHFDDGEGRHAGPARTEARHDRGLSTEIDWRGRDAKGHELSSKRKSKFARLDRWQKRARFRSKKERNIAHAFGEIDRIATALALGRDRCEQACRLFRSASEADLLMGRSIESVAAAAIYGVGRVHNLPVSIADVANVARVDDERITSSYRVLNRELGLPAAPPDPSRFVPGLASDLDCSAEVRRLAERLAGAFEDVHPTKSVCPEGVAAGAVYVASQRVGRGHIQKDVAAEADVTVVTVRSRYRDLEEVWEAIEDGE